VASLARRTLILAFARLTNQALGFLGPLFMVRLLSVEEYGHYRDFLLYGTLLLPWIQLSINSSLAYFVPKEPENERLYLSQASFFVLGSSTLMVLLLMAFGQYLPSAAVQSYLYALCLYVFFSTNLDAWEFLWLAKRQSLNVLYYSIARLGIRTAVVIGGAFWGREAGPVVWALVAFEVARLLTLALYGLKNRLFTSRLDAAAMRRQLEFSLPLGASSIVFNLNINIGQLFISMWLGPAALAVYTIGTYIQPIIQVFRNSVADVIMPEIVSRRDVEPNVALRLWQRATVVYCAVMLPLAVLLLYYADVAVETLFTSAYAAATPVFQIFTFLLVRECFDFGLPLRVVNRTGVFFVSSVTILVVNLAALLALFDWLGMLAPAIALMLAVLVAGFQLGYYVLKHCGFTLATMLPWADIGKTALVCLTCVPMLYLGDLFEMNSTLRAACFGALYLLAFVGLMQRTGIPEITAALRRMRYVLPGTAPR
jgi:O-antigen/teichoic acid export membrane protein